MVRLNLRKQNKKRRFKKREYKKSKGFNNERNFGLYNLYLDLCGMSLQIIKLGYRYVVPASFFYFIGTRIILVAHLFSFCLFFELLWNFLKSILEYIKDSGFYFRGFSKFWNHRLLLDAGKQMLD